MNTKAMNEDVGKDELTNEDFAYFSVQIALRGHVSDLRFYMLLCVVTLRAQIAQRKLHIQN